MTKNLTLGRGQVFFQRKNDDNTYQKMRYLGNTPEFSLTIETENLDHYSSDRGIREKDASVPLEVSRSGTIVCDDINDENLALFFLGSTSNVVQAAATGESETFSNPEGNDVFPLGVTDANPSGVFSVTNFAITGSVAGVDYTVDLAQGILTILEGGNLDGAAGVAVTYDLEGRTRDRVVSAGSSVRGRLRFVQANPVGPDRNYTMPEVELSPNGDFALKGDEWQTLPFNIDVLKPASGEAMYIDGVPYTP